MTVFVAVCSMFILPDFPHTTKWLSEEEKAISVRRLRQYSGSQDQERGSLFSGLKMAVLDYKVWLLAYVESHFPFLHHLRLTSLLSLVRLFVVVYISSIGFIRTDFSNHSASL